MALPSGLEKIGGYGVQGWSAIFDADMELLDEKFVSVMTGTTVLGTETVADNAAAATDPDAQTSETLTDNTGGTVSNIVADVGSSFSQTTLNDNFASLVDEINKLRADLAESRSRETEYKAAIDSLKTTLNNLIAKLRKDTGNGVLAEPA